jgi:hypothetical protein
MGRLRNKKRVQSERLGVVWDEDIEEDGGGDNNEVTHESTNDNTKEQEDGKEADDDDESKSAAEKSDSSVTAPISKRRDSDRTPRRENNRKKKSSLKAEDSNTGKVAEDEKDDDEEAGEAREECNTPGEDTVKKTKVKHTNVDKDEDARSCKEEDTDDGKIKESLNENEKEGDGKKRPVGRKTLALYKLADSLSPAMKIETGDNVVREKRPRRQPTLFNPQNCPDSEWQSDEKLILRASLLSSEDDKSGTDDIKKKSKDHGKKKKSSDNENISSKTTEIKTNERKDDNVKSDAPTEDQSPVKKNSGFLWCNFCKDDPSIPICCFCACRVCYGKHEKDKLLLCDRCDEEYHTFCLDPPLTAVPTATKWFCPTCEPLIKEELAAAKARAQSGTVTRKANVKFSAVHLMKPVPKKRSKSPGGNSTGESTATSPKISTGRPRGRPPKNKSPVVEVAVIAAPPTPALPRKRGRPPKTPPSEVAFLPEQTTTPIKSPVPRKRGRPANNPALASPQPSKKQRISQSPKHQPETKKGNLKSPPPSSSSEKRKGGPGQAGKGDNKRAKIKADGSKRGKSDPSFDVESILLPEIDVAADVKGEDGRHGKILMTSSQDEAIHEIKLSRSGRMLKRSSFHDEIEEGEQHLRSVKYAEAQRRGMEVGFVHQDEDAWEEEHDFDDEEQQEDAFEHVEEHDDDEDELKRAYEAEGNYEDVAGDEETDEQEDEPDDEMLDEMLDQQSNDPSESVVVIDEAENETVSEPAAPILTITGIATLPNDEASILPSVPEDPSNSTPLDQRKPAAGTSPSESLRASSSGAAQAVSEPPAISAGPTVESNHGLPTAEKPNSPAQAPKVPTPTAALSSDVNLTKPTGGQPKKVTAAASAATTADSVSELADTGDQDGNSGSPLIKIPRRKPGARECMQISRRFGVRVIPQKYMDTLMDYCTRGKVEHLIRMRERLDEHSRYLEAQLAGLEALVQEKGEIDVVVPPLPERPETTAGANSTGSQGGGNSHKKSGSTADASSQASQDGK